MRVRFGEFALDRGSRQLLRGKEETRLGPKAFELLDVLVGQRPRALSKAQLRDRLWPRTAAADCNLTSLVAELRRALGDNARRPRFIRTVYGFGYSFCGAATDAAEETRAPDSRGAQARLLTRGRETVLRDGENVLGRTDDAVAWIDSPTASRRHARILLSDGKATLEDLGSRNGTYLCGRRIHAPKVLVDGDEIRIGRVFITFRCLPAAASTEPESEP